MALRKIYEKEYQLCLILWENEPITASELAVLSYDKLKKAQTSVRTFPVYFAPYLMQSLLFSSESFPFSSAPGEARYTIFRRLQPRVPH